MFILDFVNVLITGASQGIGFELSKKIAQDWPHTHVLMGCRNMTRGESAAAMLKGQGLSVQCIFLDVTNDKSIAEAAAYVQATFGRLDCLVNNAGMSNDAQLQEKAVSVREIYREQFETNFFGAAQVTETFTPLLKMSTSPRLVFTSSRLGSLTQRADQHDKHFGVMMPVYRTSKAALNMLCLHYATKYCDLNHCS